ncbi:MAG: hypothetical protein QF848_15420 [Planctomycetota bacterium]|nr:hypothetical protein [Planctomycetota bacterium]
MRGPLWLPDFSDPATLGCVRHVVVDVWGIVDWDLAQAGSTRWHFGFVTPEGEDFEFQGSTEAEALVAALEAALSSRFIEADLGHHCVGVVDVGSSSCS